MSHEEQKDATRSLLHRCIDDTHCIIKQEIERIRRKKLSQVKIGSTGELNPGPSQK